VSGIECENLLIFANRLSRPLFVVRAVHAGNVLVPVDRGELEVPENAVRIKKYSVLDRFPRGSPA
jgi:hypothetical protein